MKTSKKVKVFYRGRKYVYDPKVDDSPEIPDEVAQAIGLRSDGVIEPPKKGKRKEVKDGGVSE